MTKSNYYYDEKTNANLIKEYQLLHPKSAEAKAISTKLVVNAFPIMSGIYRVHRQRKLGFTEDEARSIASEAILKSLKHFDSTKIGRNGKAVTLFNYLSKISQRSVYNFFKKELRNRTVDDNEIEEWVEYDYTIPDIVEFRSRYGHIFTGQKAYLLPVFNIICDQVENDPNHQSKYELVLACKGRIGEISMADGRPLIKPQFLSTYLNRVVKFITKAEKES